MLSDRYMFSTDLPTSGLRLVYSEVREEPRQGWQYYSPGWQPWELMWQEPIWRDFLLKIMTN